MEIGSRVFKEDFKENLASNSETVLWTTAKIFYLEFFFILLTYSSKI